MAFQYGLQEKQYKEIGARSTQKYQELLQAQQLKDVRETEKAAETTVRLKAGETVFNLLEKGYTRKTKSIMGQDYFKESTFIPSGETEGINLFAKTRAANFPGAEMVAGETVQVNPTAYESLGRELAKINPGHKFGIPGEDVAGKLVGQKWTPALDPSILHTKIGEKYAGDLSNVQLSSQLTETYTPGSTFDTSKLPPSNQAGGLNMNISEDVISSAGELTGAETKLAAELGIFSKVGKYLGPAGVAFAGLTGLHKGITSDDPTDKVTGYGAAGSAAAIGVSAAAGAGALGGAAATSAALAALGPVGWVGLAGMTAYGLGESFGLWN